MHRYQRKNHLSVWKKHDFRTKREEFTTFEKFSRVLSTYHAAIEDVVKLLDGNDVENAILTLLAALSRDPLYLKQDREHSANLREIVRSAQYEALCRVVYERESKKEG